MFEDKNQNGEKNRVTYKPVNVEVGHVLPDGAVRMSNDEVLRMQTKFVTTWKPQSDIWPFKYGTAIVGSCAALTGILINTHMRRKFFLKSHGLLNTYIPTVAITALVTCMGQLYITNKVLMMTQCETCMNVRAGVIQVFTAPIYSTLLAGPLCIQVSKNFHTYHLVKNNFQPNILHAMKTKPFAWYCYLGLIALNFSVGYAVAHLQADTLSKITMKASRERDDNF